MAAATRYPRLVARRAQTSWPNPSRPQPSRCHLTPSPRPSQALREEAARRQEGAAEAAEPKKAGFGWEDEDEEDEDEEDDDDDEGHLDGIQL